jgi:hypothetical protein
VGAVAMLQRRLMSGARLDQPVFPDVNGGFRDLANTRRELREARPRYEAWPSEPKRVAKVWPQKKVSSREGC